MDDNIEVAIRVRPRLNRELNEGLPVQWHIDGKNIYQTDDHGKPASQPYRFDHIFGGDKTNSEIFKAVVRPMIRSAMAGYNATVFAYGQTASGKTYTMLGSDKHGGIMPLTIEDIFESINHNTERKFLLRLSYIEIYNDVLYDLLDSTPKTIKIREDGTGAIHLNVEEKVIHTAEQAHAVLKQGDKLRRYGATHANQRSSRSHTIFRIIVESTPLNDDPDSDLPVHVSQVNLVDLAGSERVAQTKATGAQLREGAQINKSLHLLSLVIHQLSEGKEFRNFRDSKLTRILKDSLGGNAKTLIIGAITPTSIEDSRSTLTFTCQAKKIKNKPTINEVIDSESLTKQYIQKEKELQNQLAEMAKDKKDLEDKHIRTINELKDKLFYFKHQFIIGSNNISINQEENRRHTIGPSKIPKSANPINFSLKCATVQRNSKLKKGPPRISPLLENVGIPFSEESEQFEYKTPAKNLHQGDCLQKDENGIPEIITQKSQDINQIIIMEDVKPECVAAYTLQEGESVVAINSELTQINKDECISNHQLEQENSKLKLELKALEEENKSLKDNHESTNVMLKKTKDIHDKLKSSYQCEQEKSKLELKALEENYNSLKKELESTSDILEKTEDRLLSLTEELDGEERKNLALIQNYERMMIKLKELVNCFRGTVIKIETEIEFFNDIDDIIKYIKDKQTIPDTVEGTAEAENSDSVTENISSDISTVLKLLHNLNGLLCTDDHSILASESQDEGNENCYTKICKELVAKDKIIDKMKEELSECKVWNRQYRLMLFQTEEQNNKYVEKLQNLDKINRDYMNTLLELHQIIENLQQQLALEGFTNISIMKEQENLISNMETEIEYTIEENSNLILEFKALQESLTLQEEINVKLALEKASIEHDLFKEQEMYREKVEQLTLQYTMEINIAKNKNVQTQTCLLTEANVNIDKQKKILENDNLKLQGLNDKKNIELQELKAQILNLQQEKEVLREQVTSVEHKLMISCKESKDTINSTELKFREEITNLRKYSTEIEELHSKAIVAKDAYVKAYSRQCECNYKLTETNKALENQLAEKDSIISRLQIREKSYIPERTKLLNENQVLQMNKEEHENTIHKLMTEIKSLNQRETLTTGTENTIGPKAEYRESSNHDGDESKPECDEQVKRLQEILEERNGNIGVLDKTIIKMTNHIAHLNQLIAQRENQILKLKEPHGTFRTEVKTRRSITQDSRRSLEGSEAQLSESSGCKLPASTSLNNVLLRETHKQCNEKISQLEDNLHLSCEKFKQLEIELEVRNKKYKQLKEVAMLRHIRLQHLNAKKTDRAIQTD